MPGGLSPPLEVVQSWPKPSSNPETIGWGVVVAMVILYAFALGVVVARLWARVAIQRNAGIDDIFIVMAMVPLLGVAICFAGATRIWGFDRHIWDLTPDLMVSSRKIILAIIPLYLTATMLIRVSVLLFYRRISNEAISPIFSYVVRATICFVILSSIILLLIPFLGYRPFNAYWEQANPVWAKTHTKNVNFFGFDEPVYLIVSAIWTIIMDFITWFMPIMLFWKLHLPLRQKIALIMLFAMGFFTCICAVVRIYYLCEIFYTTYDVSWVTGNSFIWLGLEAHLGVVFASAPALKIYSKYLRSEDGSRPIPVLRSIDTDSFRVEMSEGSRSC